MRTAIWCGVIFLFAPMFGNAASFDCEKARTEVEKTICGDAQLSQLDEELGQAYKDRLQDETQAALTRQTQRQWLKERNRCADVTCLRHAYRTRLSALMAKELHAPQAATTPSEHPAGAAAFDFSVSEGAGSKICRAYVKNQNAFAPTEASVACDVSIRPGVNEFNVPEWEELEINDYWDIVYEIERRTSYSFKDSWTQDFWRKDYEGRISSGAIKPRLRRTHMRLVKGKPVLSLYGYTPNRSRVEDCKKKLAESGFGGGIMGEMVFISDESKQLLSEIRNGRPNYSETESMFNSREEHLSFAYESTLYFQRAISRSNHPSPLAEYVIWIYGVSLSGVIPPEREINFYNGAQICELYATRKVSARQ